MRKRPVSDESVASIAFLAFAVAALGLSHNAYLDDAFIHLRYAENLLELGRFSYNGEKPDFGISSPAFPSALAVGLLLGFGDLTPKLVSIGFYLISLAFLTRLWRTSAKGDGSMALVALLLALLTPSAVRWLSDGMETSLVVLLCLALAYFLAQAAFTRRRGAVAALTVLLPLALFTRIEFAGVGLFSVFILAIATSPLRRKMTSLAPLTLAIIAGLGGLYMVFGALFPDTAIAKSAGIRTTLAAVPDFLWTIVKVHLAAPAFSFLLVTATLLSIWTLLRDAPREIRPIVIVAIIAAICVPLTVYGLAYLRIQTIQGIRHFLLAEAFAVAFLVFMRLSIQPHASRARNASTHSIAKRAWILAAMLCLAELYILKPVWDGRATTFQLFSKLDLSHLGDKPCVAFDIGFFGYFSDCRVFDINGLVNGGDWAALSPVERGQRIPWNDVESVFVNQAQLNWMRLHSEFGTFTWRREAAVDITNISGPNTHYRLVRDRAGD